MENIAIPKKNQRVYSAIQPSGTITLGNYLGALKNWVTLQDEYECVYSLADLHTITVRQIPADLRRNTLEAYAMLLAVGVDPQKAVLNIQSQVHTHAELCWLLSCYTQFGELSRMTQFKDKSSRHSDNINAGLFTYPVLQAADILLYQAELVPVGEDQRQHLELSRNVAIRFNSAHGNTFTVPEALIPKSGAKIMSLQDPTKKMSKSDDNKNAFITILDSDDDILRKIKRSVTDSEGMICTGAGKEGIANLIGILATITGKTDAAIVKAFEGRGYGEFKLAVAEAVISELAPIRERFFKYIKEKDYLAKCAASSAEKALTIGTRTVNKAKKRLGLVLPQ
jgi:tryptophanyl-tRNA synthetase